MAESNPVPARLSEIRASIISSIEDAERQVARIDVELAKAIAALAERRAELTAHDRAVEAFGGAATEAPDDHRLRLRHRRVGPVVRAILASHPEGLLPEVIAVSASQLEGLSADSVVSYLVRAARKGELEKSAGLYRLRTANQREDLLAKAAVETQAK